VDSVSGQAWALFLSREDEWRKGVGTIPVTQHPRHGSPSQLLNAIS